MKMMIWNQKGQGLQKKKNGIILKPNRSIQCY